jgi:hypothetical protein
VLAFQATMSPDALVRSGRFPALADASLGYTKPIGGRWLVEAGYEATGMTYKQPTDTYWLDELDGVAGLRYLLTGPAAGWGQSDLRAGLDMRHERVQDFQGGERLVFDMTADMDELYLGYHINRARPAQQTDFDISLRLSPAVALPEDTAAHYDTYYSGRLKSARYGYLAFALDETLGQAAGLVWHSQLNGALASGPLPYYDQAIMGGQSNVRGYFLPDGSYDDALIWRNELKWPAFKNITPFVLGDIGIGHDDQLKITKTLASVGAGISVPLSRTVALSADIAHALRHAPVTAAGANIFEMNLKTSY